MRENIKEIIIIVVGIITLYFLFTSGIIENFVKFLAWIVTIDNNQPNISLTGEVIKRIIILVVPYIIVGLIFNYLGFFDKKVMAFMNFILTVLIGFGLSWLFWFVEKYFLEIFINICLPLLAVFIYWAIDKKGILNGDNNARS